MLPRAKKITQLKEFVAWDGEGTSIDEPTRYDLGGDQFSFYHFDGTPSDHLLTSYAPQPQPYVLLGNSKGEYARQEDGLDSWKCLEFMLQAKERYPNSIFVGFGFNYDINQMLKDLPRPYQKILRETNTIQFGSYWLKWLPGKSLTISHQRTKRSCTVFDVFGFFQASFVKVCEKYLGEDDPDLAAVKEGKASRNAFRWDELDDKIIPYNMKELDMLVRIMNRFREDLSGAHMYPSRWHGPGAIANEALKHYGVPISRDVPSEVLDASQFAYAGGRFEHFLMGRYVGPVYEYDIHSAYPAAATRLPNLTAGYWEHVERFEHDSFGVWRVEYRSENVTTNGYDRPEPLFCRDEDGSVSYPTEVQGWYWTPEASLVVDSVREGYVFREATNDRPFAFIERLYDQRRLLQMSKSSTERAIKLILNSIYGKLAQSVGWHGPDDKGPGRPPGWHQLEYAGFITSYTRAKLYRAAMLSPDNIIAMETDAVFSTVPLDLPVSEKLGDWELKKYVEITYLQSGYYYAVKEDGTVVCKYRGMDADRDTGQPEGLPYRVVLDHLDRETGRADRPTPGLLAYTTRFIGLGLGLKTKKVWRSWEREARTIALDSGRGSSKRYHLSKTCPLCKAGISMYRQLHPMKIGGYQGESHARQLPWRMVRLPAPITWEEWQEEHGFLGLEEEMLWQ